MSNNTKTISTIAYICFFALVGAIGSQKILGRWEGGAALGATMASVVVSKIRMTE